jgi:hypothetical protein
MKYETRKTEAGKWQAVVINPSLGWEWVYNYKTEAEAVAKIESKKQESAIELSGIKTISEYFNN